MSRKKIHNRLEDRHVTFAKVLEGVELGLLQQGSNLLRGFVASLDAKPKKDVSLC